MLKAIIITGVKKKTWQTWIANVCVRQLLWFTVEHKVMCY